ncbi:MAG: hypothetical protein M3O15_12925, partial [Acidobacteriota bacterium]|nr:hypothetical protein [Acidobacteriota bacterium]
MPGRACRRTSCSTPTRGAALLLLLLALAGPARAARPAELSLRYQSLELPGAPTAVISADVNHDGLRDLVVVVAYFNWGEISFDEKVKLDDTAGLVEALTVVPALVNRREIRVFFGRPEGGFDPAGRSLELDPSVVSVEAGPPGLPVVALTDRGISALELTPAAAGATGPGPVLTLKPLAADPSILAHTGSFLPDLGLVHDLDGDGIPDLLLPTAAGADVYLSGADGLRAQPASRLSWQQNTPQVHGG